MSKLSKWRATGRYFVMSAKMAGTDKDQEESFSIEVWAGSAIQAIALVREQVPMLNVLEFHLEMAT